MATAPSPQPWANNARLVHWAKLAVGALITAALGGFFAAWMTYVFTEKLNNKAAIQQQYLLAVQDFSTTGARLDASITELADTVLDGDAIAESRKEARQAIAAHVAATQSLSQVVGKGNADAYMAGLATLRRLVDATGNPNEALRTSRARFELMSNRATMIDEARRRIYGHS